uniref:RRM domain-containing protein n=1 Tax=Trichobilharzia regenti TaxID=157069 RepID=A0AA85KIK2_TRIRE|nr:unnamed protein product [Trichobilharzia regenti]
MPVSDVNQTAVSLTNLEIKDITSLQLNLPQSVTTLTRSTKNSTMSASTNVLGKQGNQNAAALSAEEAIVNLLERTKYTYVQENGQRRYGPPPNWKNEAPPRGCEVFIGKIPRDCFEDELIPVFEKIGPIYMFRLMMEFNGTNRGFGFCVYTNREDTKRAVQELNNYEIRKGKTIGVCLSVDNCRLFVGGIPKNKTREEILSEMKRVTEGVKDVISYPSVTDKTKNRGFAFIEYGSHKAAAMARRKLLPGHIHLWGQQIAVDWAEPEREVNEDIMSKVKILYVRNLMLSTTEESLRDSFIRAAGGDANSVERVKKISDYAFIHFREREQAAQCLLALNDTYIDGSKIEVTWAKPVDKNEVNARQPPSRTSGKLMNELVLTKDQNIAAAAAAAVVAAGGILPQLESATQFFLPTAGQCTQMATDLLSINPNSITSERTDINLGSPSGMKMNCTRTGRRNAAGSRSAGAQKDRKHPVEKLQQRQLNPLVSLEILNDLCRRDGFGSPIYNAIPIDFIDPTTGNKVQLYVGQVYIPHLQFRCHTTRFYATPAEAKLGASEVAIQSLPFNLLGLNEALAASYALPINPSVIHSNTTFVPMQLSNNLPNTSTPLNLLQSQTNILQLSGTSNFPINNSGLSAMTGSLTNNHNNNVHLPSECSAGALMTNGFDYSSQLIAASSLGNTGIINTAFGNQPAYYFDPNSITATAAAAMLIGANGLGSTTAAIPQIIGLQQSLTNYGGNELGQNCSSSSAIGQSLNSVPQPSGLYTLGLQMTGISAAMPLQSQSTVNSTSQTNSIMNLLNQSYGNPVSVLNGSLPTTQTNSGQNSHTSQSSSV